MVKISLYTIAKAEGIHYCVYKFLDKDDNVLYIGKSKQFKTRIFNHLRNKSHLPNECIEKINRIEFLDFKYECDMNIFELYCISYYNPPYNKDSKSPVGVIHIDVPKIWNELDMESFIEIRPNNIMETKTDKILKFNKDIFLNEELSQFLNNHFDKILSDIDIKTLQELCKMSEFNIKDINDYIAYNNNKAEIINDNGEIKLIKRKKGRNGYGTFSRVKIRDTNYIYYKTCIDGEQHSFYGKTKDEIANRIYNYMSIIELK